MATVAEFTSRPSQFPIVKVFAEYPLVDVEIEQLKQTDTSVALYFSLNTQSTPPAASDFLNYDIFNSVERLDALSNEHLYSERLNNDHESIWAGITKSDVELESAKSNESEWVFRLRAESAEQLSTFQACCQEHDFGVRLSRFPTEIQIFNSQEYNLTDKQHEALALAYTEGYFEAPRRTTLEELGETLDITQQAVIARLRNGEKNLLENTIVHSVNSESNS